MKLEFNGKLYDKNATYVSDEGDVVVLKEIDHKRGQFVCSFCWEGGRWHSNEYDDLFTSAYTTGTITDAEGVWVMCDTEDYGHKILLRKPDGTYRSHEDGRFNRNNTGEVKELYVLNRKGDRK